MIVPDPMRVPFFEFDCSEGEIAGVEEVLRSGWLTTGRKTQDFEIAFANRCRARHALAVNSCTAALHLALEALNVGTGDKVIVPSLTFTATAEIVRYLGADPVFADIEFDTGLLTAGNLRKTLKQESGVKACIVVHYGGQSAELTGKDGILDACAEFGIALVQDAAHAFPAFDDYGPVGSVGDATCFSFYANKTITTGEGGMIVTNDDAIARRVKIMRLHGIDRDVWNRFTSDSLSWEYDVVAPGFKYNMPDICAAIGLAQLERADEFRTKRQSVAARYLKNLESVPEVATLRCRVPPDSHAWHLFPIIVGEQSRLSRNELIAVLLEDGISTSVHYKPLHRMTYYAQRYDLNAKEFPNTEAFWRGCISLPIYPGMTIEQVDYVTDRIKHHLQSRRAA